MASLNVRLASAVELMAEFVDDPPVSGALSDGRLHLMVELETPPAARIYAEERVGAASLERVVAVTQAHLATIEQEQERVAGQLEQLDIDEIYRLQRVYNGFAILADERQIDAVTSLPGVAAVHPLVPKMPDHNRSMPFVRAPEAWGGISGLPASGEGVTIAVIDTGIDYLHADFGGSQDYAGNDTTIIGDVPDFPGNKVVAGYDFAGDDYGYPFYLPIPDPDPADCWGHGTHVAGTAAGRGISTLPFGVYPGPYDEYVFESGFVIGPGVAPAAKLMALKIFGCYGGSYLTELAIEWAVDPNGDGDFSDRADIINMSLGSGYGSIYDPTAIASDNAALIGSVVVASAGNSGDAAYITGAPAIASRAISVAATDDHLADVTAAMDAGVDTGVSSFSSRGPRRWDSGLKPDISAPGRSIQSARSGSPGTEGSAKSGTSMAAPHVSGALALLRQAHPNWRVEELKALVMNTARLQNEAMPSPYSVVRVGSGTLDVANALNSDVVVYNGDDRGMVGISFGTPAIIDTGAAVKNLYLKNNGEQEITYLLGYIGAVDTPGVEYTFGRDRVTVPAGGSASVPVVMSAVADDMRHTLPPNVAELQSEQRHWLTEESGYVMLWPEEGVFAANVAPFGATTPAPGSDASATFTYSPTAGLLTYAVSLENFDPFEVDAAQIWQGQPGDAGVLAYSLELPDEWSDSSVPITGSLLLNAADIPLLASGSLQLRILTSRVGAEELHGQIGPRPAVLHLPVFAAPRPASDMRAADPVLTFSIGDEESQSVHLVGHDLLVVEPPTGYASLVSPFELQYSSPNSRPAGISGADITDHADIHYVGLSDDRSAIPGHLVEESTIYFGIAAHADWSTPAEVGFDIYIDFDEDGSDDYRLFNADSMNPIIGGAASDAFLVSVEDLTLGRVVHAQTLNVVGPQTVDTALFNTNVMVMPVCAACIGLSDTDTDFDYHIQSWSQEVTSPVESTPTLHYDLDAKAIDLFSYSSEGPPISDLDGGRIDLHIDAQNFIAAGNRDLLLLHHQNISGNRAEVVDVQFEWPYAFYLPLIAVE